MNFLIIGGAGFIGSHLTDYLLKLTHTVTIVDNYSTGSKNNLADHPNLLTSNNLENSIRKVDYVFHLAASVGNKYIDENPHSSIINNLTLMEKVFQLTHAHRKPVLFASTSEVYGNSNEIPFKESQSLLIGCPEKPRWGYSCAKLMGEFLALSYKMPLVIIRPFNIVGPRQVSDYGMVVPSLIKNAKEGKDILVYGDGQQTRCFCYVKEAVRAMYRLVIDSKCYRQIFNIGNPQEISIEDLANKVKRIFESQSNIVFKSYDKTFKRNHADIIRRIPDISKIKKFIGWEPTVNIDQILHKIKKYEVIFK